jgi:putative oxidoreductase
MRRLYYTLADRLPSHGLLLLRVVAGAVLILGCVQIRNGASIQTFAPHLIAAGGGLLLLIGLWTSVAGAIVAITELSIAFSHSDDPWVSVLLASLGVALALLGPGAWSVDAQRFGWKRIEIPRPDK